jgi:uncharacterized protein YkwD
MKQLMIPITLLAALVAVPAHASPRCAEGELLSEELEPRATKLVIKVVRLCRDGVCVRIRRIVEVEDTEQDGRPVVPELDAPLPDLTPRRVALPRELPAPTPAAPPAPAPAAPPASAPAAPPASAPAAPPAPAPAAPPAAPASACGSALESAALALASEHRVSLGLSLLRCDPLALRAARAHSQDMCARSYFAHESPEGKLPWDRLRAAGARFQGAGENIAAGYGSAAEVHAGWLASPGHRANIERTGMTRAAVGVVDCGGRLIWTQLFLR